MKKAGERWEERLSDSFIKRDDRLESSEGEHRAEVMDVILAEYNEDLHIKSEKQQF